MPREVTTHHIPEHPSVAELRVFASDPDGFEIPHCYEFGHDRYDADDEAMPIVLTLRLQSGDPRKGWNGVTTLSVLAALKDFLEACQRSKFAAGENRLSINYLGAVIEQLKNRVRRRVVEGTMHTHQAGAGETPSDPAIPRRVRQDQHVTAEKTITQAMRDVEAMPADVRLTDAMNLLLKARERVADFVDGKP